MSPLALVAAMFLAPALIAQSDGQSSVIQSGDYVFMELPVRRVPVEVEASYQVATPGGAVHMELLPRGEFRSMQRGAQHRTLAATSDAPSGTIRHIVVDPGPYRLVVGNRAGSVPATVMWQISTRLDPQSPSTGLSPRRRMATIAISFLLFFAMVGYSGWRLKRAIRE